MNEYSFMNAPELDKRARILDAALALFTESAYASTTVPHIAERAGVAAGTIYRYFPSKEALANEIYQEQKSAMRDALVVALTKVGDTGNSETEVHACWHALLGLLRNHRNGVLFLEGQQHAAYLTDASKSVAAEVDQIAFDVIARGQASGQIKNDRPDLLVAMVFGAFVGIARVCESPTDAVSSFTASAAWDLIAQKAAS